MLSCEGHLGTATASTYHTAAAKPSATTLHAPSSVPLRSQEEAGCASGRFLLISRSSCFIHTLAFGFCSLPLRPGAPRFIVLIVMF
jgi:hypothetical protein